MSTPHGFRKLIMLELSTQQQLPPSTPIIMTHALSPSSHGVPSGLSNLVHRGPYCWRISHTKEAEHVVSSLEAISKG